MKLNENYFYCFGCGVHGDVIDLTAGLFQISNYEAANKLISDFGLNGTQPVIPRTSQFIGRFQNKEILCNRVLTDYLHLLEDWKRQHYPRIPEDKLDKRYVEACQMLPYIEYLTEIMNFGTIDERNSVIDMLLKDNKISSLQAYINKERKEEIYDAYHQKCG